MPENRFPALLLGIEADKSRNFRDKVQYFTDNFLMEWFAEERLPVIMKAPASAD